MATKTKKSETWPIPVEYHDEIRALSQAEDDADVRADCAKARLKKAIESGDTDEAIKEKRIVRESTTAYKAAHDAFWNRIHEVIPDLEEDGAYGLDSDSMEISEHRSRMGGLSGMFGRDD